MTQPDAAGRLYAAHRKIHPRAVAGTFRRLKTAAAGLLLAIYFVAPWLRWERAAGAPDQAILLDMPGRRGWFFGIEIWPQKVYFLTGLLILGAVGLFLATSLFGRVWCGFACPQTVWTDLFLRVERFFEGDRNARLKLDAAPWSAGKLARKAAKNSAWLAIAAITSATWLFYFNDAPTTLAGIATGAASPAIYGFLFLFTATTFLLAGYAREQVCIYMCPWPRFQAAMMDESSLIVTYEKERGEPRGPAKASEAKRDPQAFFAERGHCIDCGLCVQVCPTGTDIRNGNQLSCIGCGLCIDACAGVMEKIGLPKNLIVYDSVANQVARAKGQPQPTRLLRPRTFIYAALLAAVAATMAAALLLRMPADLAVLADRSPLYVRLSDGAVRNAFTVKISNKALEERRFSLVLSAPAQARLSAVGQPSDGQRMELAVAPDSVGAFRIFVDLPADSVRRIDAPLRLELHLDGRLVDQETRAFALPAPH